MIVEEMTHSETEGFLKSSTSGVLATCLGDIPYCVPMAYGYDGESFYFIIPKGGRILSYLQSGANVACFTVFEAGLDVENYVSVIVEGIVSKVEGHEIIHAASVIEKQLRKPKGRLDEIVKSSMENGIRGFYKLTLKTKSGRKKIDGVF